MYRGYYCREGDRQQFGLGEKMDAAGPVPEARSEASQASPSRLITAVRFGREAPRLMTTLMLPSASNSADSNCGRLLRPFCVPLMYSSAQPPASPKKPLVVRAARRSWTAPDSGHSAQLLAFEQATQWFGAVGSIRNNPRALRSAPARSLGVGVGLEGGPVAEGPPQAANITTAIAETTARRTFIVPPPFPARS